MRKDRKDTFTGEPGRNTGPSPLFHYSVHRLRQRPSMHPILSSKSSLTDSSGGANPVSIDKGLFWPPSLSPQSVLLIPFYSYVIHHKVRPTSSLHFPRSLSHALLNHPFFLAPKRRLSAHFCVSVGKSQRRIEERKKERNTPHRCGQEESPKGN